MHTRIRGIIAGDTKPSDVIIEKGRIVSITTSGRGRADYGGPDCIIGPTLFDIQVNGAMGIDLQSPDLCVEDVADLSRLLAARGVAQWVPTIITNAPRVMAKSCRTIAQARKNNAVARAIPGIHLEGPCISPEDGPRGAHARQYVRKPDLSAFDKLYEAADGAILYTTVAPELPGAVDYIKALVARGVAVSLGHHIASPDQIGRAIDAGATLATHLGNGIGAMLHRHNNPIWPQLADDRLAASLLADMQHLPAPVLKSMIRAKRPENVVLASDAVHIAGMPPGNYMLGETPVELLPSGRICLSGTDLLGGSSLMLIQGVLNAVGCGAMTLREAFASASTIPARILKIKHPGFPAPGKKAQFILFQAGDPARIDCVYINGEMKL